MPIDAGTLQRIAQGGTLPQNTLAGQIADRRRAAQQQQYDMQTGIQKMLMQAEKNRVDAMRKAVESQKDRFEMGQDVAAEQLRQNLGVAERLSNMDPQGLRQRISQNPNGNVANFLRGNGIDPNSPTLGQDIEALRNSLYAQSEGKLFELGGGQTFNLGGEPSPFDKARTGAFTKKFESAAESQRAASDTKQLTAGMSDLIVQSDVETGKLQPAITTLQGLAEGFGVDLQSFAGGMGIDLGNLSKKEEFHRLARELTINQFEKFKGNLNSSEVDIALDSVAQLGNNKDANIRALAAIQASAELAEERAIAKQYAEDEQDLRAVEERISNTGVDEFRELRDEIEDRLREESARAERIEGPAKTPLTQEEALAEVPEGGQLGQQNDDGTWNVLDSEGNLMGIITEE